MQGIPCTKNSRDIVGRCETERPVLVSSYASYNFNPTNRRKKCWPVNNGSEYLKSCFRRDRNFLRESGDSRNYREHQEQQSGNLKSVKNREDKANFPGGLILIDRKYCLNSFHLSLSTASLDKMVLGGRRGTLTLKMTVILWAIRDIFTLLRLLPWACTCCSRHDMKYGEKRITLGLACRTVFRIECPIAGRPRTVRFLLPFVFSKYKHIHGEIERLVMAKYWERYKHLSSQDAIYRYIR